MKWGALGMSDVAHFTDANFAAEVLQSTSRCWSISGRLGAVPAAKSPP